MSVTKKSTRSGLGCVLLVLSLGCSNKPDLDEAALHLVNARNAIAAEETDEAMDLLSKSIAARPDPWAFYERARLYMDQGDDEAAKADVQAGLQLDEQHSELIWLQEQLKKSKKSRFKGKSGQPPMYSK